MNWTKIGHLATVAASFTAVIALFWQLYTFNKLASGKSLELWKQTAVFTIISDSRLDGVSFDGIKTKYLQKITQEFSKELQGTDVVQDSTLTYILLTLRSSNLVYKTIDNKYKDRLTRNEISVEENNAYLVRKELDNALMKKMALSSCKITVTDLEKYMLSEVKSEFKDVSLSINSAIGSRYINFNDDKYLCLLQDHDPHQIINKKFREKLEALDKRYNTQLDTQQKMYDELMKEIRNDALKSPRGSVKPIGEILNEVLYK